MPKRHKTAQSPGRVSRTAGGGDGDGDGDGEGDGAREAALSRTSQEEILKSMQDIFSDLDPGVIYMVLSEAKFEVENAMDALLELSDAANSQWRDCEALDVLDQQLAQTDSVPATIESSTASNLIELQQNSDMQAACLAKDTASAINQEKLLTSLENELVSLASSPPLSSQTLSSRSPHSVDFSYLAKDTSLQRPSDFNAYRGHDQFAVRALGTPGVGNPAMILNIQAPDFQPRSAVPAFITPVMQGPNAWSRQPFPTGLRFAGKAVSQTLLKPNAFVPRALTLPPPNRLRLEGQVLVLLRGAPGSGKTTLARAMLEVNPGGVILSTDEYFTCNGRYHYEPSLLGEAHAWNHRRAKEAFEQGHTPIIIDNTNMQCWEMKPYVAMALKHNYKVLFREPDTWWKFKPKELEKRTQHGVTKEKIRRMLDQQDRHVSVRNIMCSQPKPDATFGVEIHEFQTCPTQPILNAVVGEIESPELRETVSSHEGVSEQNGTPQSELLDGEALDRDLDACLLESTDLYTNEAFSVSEEGISEQSVEFSDSIAQRIRRERGVRTLEGGPGDCQLPDNSVRKGIQEDAFKEGCTEDAELLHFIGDWPSESLEQRGQRSRKCRAATSGVQTPTNGNAEVEMKDQPCSSPDVKGQKRQKEISQRAGQLYRLALEITNKSMSSDCLNAGSPVTSLQPADLTFPPDQLSDTQSCASVQTDPRDFSLLWRIEHQKSYDPAFSEDVVIMEGSPFRFVPNANEEKSSGQHGVPYRVCHEKGSQVEESDLKEMLTKQESLDILHHFFKLVPVETLEDLYEKCHQDLEWTINLLLDSGEMLFRGDADCPTDDLDHLMDKMEDLLSEEKSSDEHILPDTRNEHISEDMEETPLSRHFTDTHPEQNMGQYTFQENPLVSGSTDSDSSKSETQNPPAGLQEVTSVSEKEMFDQEDLDAIIQLVLAQVNEEEPKKKEEKNERGNAKRNEGSNWPVNIQKLEFKLPTELALQLSELFGPVGISPDEFSPENCSVLMDLNLAKLLHQNWKETIQERQRQAALSYHLLQESSVHWGDTQPAAARMSDSAAQFLVGADGYSSLLAQSGIQESLPFMDHWNTAHQPVSLRNIMLEEQEMQKLLEKSRTSRSDVDKKDSAAILKENRLFSLFPAIDRHFITDIFKDHNYSQEKTELFLRSLFDDGPVRNVVAPEATAERSVKPRASSKDRTWKQKNEVLQFQDTEDPEYEDFRTEAVLQRRRQQECYSKAAEAYRQGRWDVASFYAQQGRLHGQKIKEANHRAAVQIFQRVNATLLPQNVLDLHGLHVDEALQHLQQVLEDKTKECHQGLCRPHLSIITGRGNRSQGGVARIRPVVLDYLKSQHYRYIEPNEGLVVVTLQTVTI